MSNSSLVSCTILSPNHSGQRNHKIDTITIHMVVGQCTAEALGQLFANPNREASSNYGVDKDGRIGLYVEECNRSWCSSSPENDHRAITIEVASDTYYPYAITDAAYEGLIKLVADICQRNGIEKLVWSDNKEDRVNHRNGCNMTCHKDFAATLCPGTYIYDREAEIARRVNELIGLDFKVGDVVNFKGGKHYTSSNDNTGYDATPGKATITYTNPGSKHPYSLVRTADSTSNVYGWVDIGTFEKIDVQVEQPTIEEPIIEEPVIEEPVVITPVEIEDMNLEGSIWTKEVWQEIGERAISTACETFLSVIGATAALNEINWHTVLITTAGATLISFVKNLWWVTRAK